MDDSKELRNVSIVAGALVVIFILLFGINLPVKENNSIGLASDIQYVIDLNSENHFEVNKPLLVKSPLQSTLAIYRLEKSAVPSNESTFPIDTDLASYACIIRLTGVCGPVPVVYIYSKTFGAKYLGVAGSEIKNQDYETKGLSYTQIQYWGKKITNLIEETANE